MKQQINSILIPLATLGIIIAIGVFWTIPTVKNYLRVKSDIVLEQKELNESLIPQRDILANAESGEIEAGQEVLGKAILAEPDPGLLLAIVEDIANTTGVTVTNQQYIGKEIKQQTIQCSFRVFGPVSRVRDFLVQLEAVNPTIYVQEIASVLAGVGEDDSIYPGLTIMNTFVTAEAPYGTQPAAIEGYAALVVSEEDKQLIQDIELRHNYLDTPLYYQTHGPFPAGKQDPFTE